ncbi:MAG: MFS transporter [Pseudomonadota bacterium]
MTSQPEKSLQPRSLIAYGFLALPIAFAGFPLYILAPDFYAVHYNISLTSLAGILLFLRLCDAVQDPLFGYLADRYRTQTRSIVISAGLILSVAFLSVFNPISEPLIWFACTMFLAMSCYSLLSILLGSSGALWSSDPAHQTFIASIRESFGLIGLIIAVTLPSVFNAFTDVQSAYLGLWIILTVFLTGGILSFYRWHKKNIVVTSQQSYSLKDLLTGLRQASKKFLWVYAISMFASSIPAVLVIFYVRDLLDAEAYLGLFLLLYFVSGAVFMSLWRRLALKYGKYQIWCASMLLAIISFIGAFFLGTGDILFYAIVCILSGAALGADLMIPPALLGEDMHNKGQTDHMAAHYALLAFFTKGALAFASIFALPAIEYFGFVPDYENSADALFSLSVTYALIPCVLKALSAFLLYKNFLLSSVTLRGNL